jgi:hypothetical protein
MSLVSQVIIDNDNQAEGEGARYTSPPLDFFSFLFLAQLIRADWSLD